MKSTFFKVNHPYIQTTENSPNDVHDFTLNIEIPILPAFSIEYLSIQLGALSYTYLLSDDPEGAQVSGNKIITQSDYNASTIEHSYDGLGIILHYQGIRDYSLLFPWIANKDLRERLGMFYEEAEKCFNQGSWLSFSLMCGALFEGMLYAKLNRPTTNNNFFDMINQCQNTNLLTSNQADIMNNVRKLRNLIHANNFTYQYATRKDATDIKSTMDQLIKSFSI